jgi:AcrR family transcriptional regulator
LGRPLAATAATVRTGRREIRRQELIEAAIAVFSAKGLSAASVDDIVRAAGVAKGTFYLYFATKDDAVNTVATAMVEGVAERVEAVANDWARSPVERLLAFGAGISEVGDESYERELIEVFHRPENRLLHDRIGDRAFARLAPAIAAIIADGIEAGEFRHQDPHRAAAYVMACFGSLHEIVATHADVPGAIAELNAFVLRGLGYEGEVSS